MRYYEVNRPSHAIQTFQKRKIFSGSCRNPALPPCPRRVTARFGQVCSPLYIHPWAFKKPVNLSQKTALEFGAGLARCCNHLGTDRAPHRASPGTVAASRSRTLPPCAQTPAGMLCPWGEGKSRGQGWSGAARGISQGRKYLYSPGEMVEFLLTSRDLLYGPAVLRDEPLQPHHAAGLPQRARWAKAAPPTPPFCRKGPTLAPVRPAPGVQKTSGPPTWCICNPKSKNILPWVAGKWAQLAF